MMASYLTAHGDTKESVIFAFHVRCGSIDLLSFHFVKLHGGIYVQRAKKVVYNSPGLVDFAIGLVIFVLNLPNGQVLFWGEL